MARRRAKRSLRPRGPAGRNRAVSGARRRQFLEESLRETLGEAEALLIVPPFARLRYPSLAVHLLQACCRQSGLRVDVLYANLLLAALLGEETYSRICDAPTGSFAAERLFARAAFGGPALGRHAGRMFDPPWEIPGEVDVDLDPAASQDDALLIEELRRREHLAEELAGAVAEAAAGRGYAVVGCTTMFEQTAASVAILRRVKQRNRGIVTALGGANCEGEMGRGLASLNVGIDYIFSGESEEAFPAFLRTVLGGARPAGRIIAGQLCRDLDRLPPPDYSQFFEQRKRFLPSSPTPQEEMVMLYETSRGCWWGEKHHCTFCGLNGEGMAFRQKSPNRVLEDLRHLTTAHPARNISMTDNIMPLGYFKTLIPLLARELPNLSIFYEQKANLSLAQMMALRQAGVQSIQPGIEALSTRLLQLMRKGVSARQNVTLLRYVRATGIEIAWNLLWGFPGDGVEEYEETLALVPLLHHLPPPDALWHISIDRFSPYFDLAKEFRVRNLRPVPGYFDFLPKQADVRRIAYHFTGEYASGSHQRVDVIEKLLRAVDRWRKSWTDGKRPEEELRIFEADGAYVLMDTREAARVKGTRVLSREEAELLLAPRLHASSAAAARAIEDRLAVTLDGWFVPLAVAEADLLAEFLAPNASSPAAAQSLQAEAALNVLG
jgi:ribosomal peptide maturation radical SAM protein 1